MNKERKNEKRNEKKMKKQRPRERERIKEIISQFAMQSNRTGRLKQQHQINGKNVILFVEPCYWTSTHE